MNTKKIRWGEDPEFSGPRNWFRNSLIIKEVLAYKTRGKILDFGCGSGDLLRRLAKMDFEGVGTDNSRLAINYLKKSIKKEPLKHKITPLLNNEKLLSSKKYQNHFDIVVAGEVLEHIKDDRNLVKNLSKVLKKSGICVVSVPAHKYLWDINDNYSAHYRRYDQKGLTHLFKSTGFKVKKVYYYGFPLSWLWHNFVFLPLIKRRMIKKKVYSDSPGILGFLLTKDLLKRLFSTFFWFDQLFNWTKLGIGLILVAKK